MSAGPTLQPWTARELADATVMNTRVRDVHTWLAHPPSVRLHGAPRSISSLTDSILTFYTPGSETISGHSFATATGMTAPPSTPEGYVRSLVAPVPGWYRINLGVGLWCETAFNGWPGRNVWAHIAVNPAAESGAATAAAAVAQGGIGQASPNLHLGTLTADWPLQAGDTVAVALTVEGSVAHWADATKHVSLPHVSFLELHWGGER
jgi:hypothetical protein